MNVLEEQSFEGVDSVSFPIKENPVNFPHHEKENLTLVIAIQQREKFAEDALVSRYRRQLVGRLIKLCQDHALAEDFAHDTLMVVLERLRGEGIQHPHRLTSFVFSTARFLYYGWLRKKDNQLELRQTLETEVRCEYSPQDHYEEYESHLILERSIEQLDLQRDRDILTRRYVSQQSKPEICDAMDLTRTNYDRVISRARFRLLDGCRIQ